MMMAKATAFRAMVVVVAVEAGWLCPRVEWTGVKNLRSYFTTQHQCFLYLQISDDFRVILWL